MGHRHQIDAPHLVLRLFTPRHPFRWIRRIARVLRRVVPVNLDLEPRPLRQRRHFLEEIPVLPGKVPILNVEQRLYPAIRQSRRHFHLLRQVMRMRADAHCIDGDRQRIRITDDEVLFPRRDVQPGE